MSGLVTGVWLGKEGSELAVSPPTSPGDTEESWEDVGLQKEETNGQRKKVRFASLRLVV
jgi:hypothetical protein